MSKLVDIKINTGLGISEDIKGSVIKVAASISQEGNNYFGTSSNINISKIVLDYYDVENKKFKPAAIWERLLSVSKGDKYVSGSTYQIYAIDGEGTEYSWVDIENCNQSTLDALFNADPKVKIRRLKNQDKTDVIIYFHNDATRAAAEDEEYCTQYISKNLFRVNVIFDGATAAEIADMPCMFRLDENYAYTFDPGCNIQASLSYLNELANTCEVPKGFIDFILKTKALDLAIKFNNEELITEYYTKFIACQKPVTTKTCGCYGRTAS